MEFKSITDISQLDSLVIYCESWRGHYFTYDIINGYRLTPDQSEYLRNRLRDKGYDTTITFNSHNVKSFWVR